MSNRKAVGIDLGTTFSAVSHIDAYGKPQIIPNSESERITPSVILFDGAKAIVGTVAKNNTVAEPEKIVDFVKREIGKAKDQFHRDFDGKSYSAEELSALILRKLKLDAEKYLKVPVTDAVITVPAYFNDSERTATITAGRLAGLNVLQIINEPTAAALAYGLDKLDDNQTVFVFDLGGGTFDVTLMRIEGHRLEMIATNGDHRLGGKDWDDVIVNHVAEEFDRAHGENPLLDLQSYQDLQSRALAAKIQLSSRERTTIVQSHNGKSVKVELTREDFEKMTRHLVEKCKGICEIVMREAKMEWSQVTKILLVGGMTRMPMVRKMISDLASVPLAEDVNPDEAVAVGASIQAVLSLLQEEDKTGEKTLPADTRQQFSSREGGTHPGSQHRFAYSWRGALGRVATRGIRVPNDQENERDASGGEEFFRHRHCQHAASDCQDCGRREHVTR
jgi:molecular chaperone DnaK